MHSLHRIRLRVMDRAVRTLIPHLSKKAGDRQLAKPLSLSHWISEGNPAHANIESRASTTWEELSSLSGTTSANFVATQRTVRMYRQPFFDSGSGPTMSITGRWKGSVINGTSFKGAFHLSVHFPTLWHVSQERTKSSVSFQYNTWASSTLGKS